MNKISRKINILLIIILVWFLKSNVDDHIYQKIVRTYKDIFYSIKVKKECVENNKAINLQIKQKHLNKLIKTRELCLREGYIGYDIPNPYYPAIISTNNDTFKVKVRFKGDFLDHIIDEKKWSLKVKVKNGKTIFGMREFAIQRPETRKGFGEYVFHRFLHYNNLLSIPYDFIWVKQNNNDNGLYAYEGRFKKNFFKINDVEPSPILRINDELYFKNKRKFKELKRGLHTEDWSSYSALIDAYELKSILRDSILKTRFEEAVTKLENFRTGKFKAKEVFNLNKLAKFYAICDLFGAYHAQQFPNLRFYYNPSEKVLEPIGFDAGGLSPTDMFFGQELSYANEPSYSGRRYEHRLNFLLEDEDFLQIYNKYLQLFTEKDFLNRMSDSIAKELKERVKIQKQLSYNHDFLKRNQEFIRSKIYPIKIIHSFKNKITYDTITLNVSNPGLLPVKILNIMQNNYVVAKPLFNQWLPARPYDKIAKINNAKFLITNKEFNPKEDLFITCKIPGIDSTYNEIINPWNNQIEVSD